jgi:alkylmercury lyase
MKCEEIIAMPTKGKVDIEALSISIVECFPKLNSLEQRLSLELDRLLAAGRAVPCLSLAEKLGEPVETVNRILDNWPGVFSDPLKRVVGYWGLALPAAYPSPHKLTVDGRTLSAWCAWDTLFLPQLLGEDAAIESTSPQGGRVTLTVTPERLERVEPNDACMSVLVPDAAAVQKDVVAAFCHFVHFFPSREAGESWTAERKGTFLLSMEDAYAFARRKNELQYTTLLA